MLEREYQVARDYSSVNKCMFVAQALNVMPLSGRGGARATLDRQ
jgi:hypothetical protein